MIQIWFWLHKQSAVSSISPLRMPTKNAYIEISGNIG